MISLCLLVYANYFICKSQGSLVLLNRYINRRKHGTVPPRFFQHTCKVDLPINTGSHAAQRRLAFLGRSRATKSYCKSRKFAAKTACQILDICSLCNV